jgi:predicted amidohydrolase YtcJ
VKRTLNRLATAVAAAIVICLAAALASPSLRAQQAAVPPELIGYPQTILTNGKILTVDRSFTIAQAIALRDGRVLAVGTNAAIQRLAGPQTESIDLGGKSVIPGIVDTHWHPWNGALAAHVKDIAAREPRFADFSNRASIKGGSVAELLQNLKAAADSRRPGSWISATIDSPELGLPFWDKVRRRELDAAVPNNPLMVSISLPIAPGTMINSKAIDAMKAFYGYTSKEYELDAKGEMTGRIDVVLAESLMADLLFDHPMETFYPIFKEENLRLASFGVTTDSARLIGLWYEPVFREMDRRHEMPIRIAYSALGTQVFPYASDFYKRLGDVTDMGTDMLWMAGVGVVHIDLGPCSTIRPQTEVYENCLISKPDDLKYKALYQAVKYGNRIINTHVSGDRSADELMDLIEAASKEAGMTSDEIRAKGHAMDHCSMNPRPDQIERGKQLGIIWACAAGLASMEWASQIASLYGEEYANKWIAPVGSIIKAGGRVAGHGETARGDSYFSMLEQLLTRKDSLGRIWGAKEAIDRKDLLRMYTIWAADYVARPDRLGSLEPGKFADLVVLDRDYMTIPIEEFHTLHPVMTMVGGKVVFQKSGR